VRILLKGGETVVIPVDKIAVARSSLGGGVGDEAPIARVEQRLAPARRRWAAGGRQQAGRVGEFERGQHWSPNAGGDQRHHHHTEQARDDPIGSCDDACAASARIIKYRWAIIARKQNYLPGYRLKLRRHTNARLSEFGLLGDSVGFGSDCRGVSADNDAVGRAKR